MLLDLLHLLRWLGPWADTRSSPQGAQRERLSWAPPEEPGRRLEALLYRPATGPVRRAWVVAHGLHPLGPEDPRLDRFLRVLASGGALVLAPSVEDYRALQVVERAVFDFQHAVRALLRHPALPPGLRPSLWSVSFGSLLALRAATAPDLASRVGGVMTFGGFFDWHETVRFCVTGQVEGQPQAHHDPLNRPVVYMNLLPEMDDLPAQGVEEAVQAWFGFVERTWSTGASPKKSQEAPAIAQEMAQGLPEASRALFLDGCGVTPRSQPRALDALERSLERLAWIKLEPWLPSLQCPVHLVHGAEDDVIPSNQLERLAQAMPPGVPVFRWRTGLYGHSAAQDKSPLDTARAVLAEVQTLLGMLRALASGAQA